MKKGLISKFLSALLVVGLLFSILPSQQAQAQTPSGYTFVPRNTGITEFSTEQAYSGSKSVKLATIDGDDVGMIRFEFAPGELKLDDLTHLSYYEYVAARQNPLDVFVDIWLDVDDNGVADTNDYPGYLQAEPLYTVGAAPMNTWTYIDAMTLKWQTFYGPDDPYNGPTIADFQAHNAVATPYTSGLDYGELDILRIDIRVGYGGTWANFTGYADDIKINGYTEDFPVTEVWVDDDFTTETPGWGVTHFATIQGGIDGVLAGGTVHVAAGTYVEDIVIGKALTLQGPNAGVQGTGTRSDEAIVKFVGPGWAGLYVAENVPGVTIDGFTFDGANLVATANSYTAGVVSDSSNFTLQNNIFINHKDMAIYTSGVYYDGSSWKYDKYLTDILIKDNKITNAMPNTSGFSYGIYLQSSNGTVTGNFVTDVSSGIQVQPYWNTIGGGVIENNTFQAYRWPVYFNYNENDAVLWDFNRNIITGIPIPAGVADKPFNAVRVETMSKGLVNFYKNQITFGGATNAEQYLYFENNVTGGTRSASPNWWGAVTGPDLTKYSGDAGYLPYCLDPECTLFSKASLYMTPDPISASCGTDEYTVEVMVKDIVGLQSYDLELEFDHERIQIVKVENGDLLDAPGTPWFENDLGNDDGKLSWGWAPTGERNVTGSGSLIKITFKTTAVAGNGTFTIMPASVLNDYLNASDIPFEITGGATVSTASVVTNTSMTPNKSYCDLATAVTQANSGDTLQADVDFNIPATVTIDKAITLDLNGKVATAATGINTLTVITDGALVIDDSDTAGTGKITGGYRAAMVNGGGSLVLNKGTLEGSGFDGVFIYNNDSSLTVNGGTITGLYYGISGNGSATGQYAGAPTILINNGTIQGGETAIFHPQAGLLTINDGNIIGGSYNGIEMKGGDLVITGGTITTSAAFVPTPGQTSNGNTQSGDAILIYNRAGYPGTMTVDISGTPVITSTNGYALREYTFGTEPLRTDSIEISGGSFTGGVALDSVTFVSGLEVLALTGGDYQKDPIVFVESPYGTSLHTDIRWYISGLPVLTSDDFDDSVTLGVGSSFTLTINPSVPGEFAMVFTGYPSETEITYDGVTYTCVGDPCVITVPVTLTGDSQDLVFGLVVATGGEDTPAASYDVTATLHAPAPAYGTDGRDLAHLDATVAVTSGFGVTGTFTMQGRTSTKAGIPVTLTWNNTFGVAYGPTMVTTEDAVNFNLAVNYGGSYTLTTLQPRYLNVYAGLGKTFDVTGPRLINSLWLRAGNAVWKDCSSGTCVYDNEIDLFDAQQLSGDWGNPVTTDLTANSGDVNFDGVLSIKDLSLIGGNMDLTSAEAYGVGASVWIP